jgi:hypothetical protein
VSACKKQLPGEPKTVIETEELLLRSWRTRDEEPYTTHCNTAEVMHWLGGKQSRKALRDDLIWFANKEAEFGTTFWVVEKKDDGIFLGWCGLVVLEKGDEGVPLGLVASLRSGGDSDRITNSAATPSSLRLRFWSTPFKSCGPSVLSLSFRMETRQAGV